MFVTWRRARCLPCLPMALSDVSQIILGLGESTSFFFIQHIQNVAEIVCLHPAIANRYN